MLDDFGRRSWGSRWQLRQSLTKNRVTPEQREKEKAEGKKMMKEMKHKEKAEGEKKKHMGGMMGKGMMGGKSGQEDQSPDQPDKEEPHQH